MKTPLFPVTILAGGLATRLRPISERIPKSLIDVNGEPFVAHQLHLLRRAGIEDVVICVGHLGERIKIAVGDGERFQLRVTYSFDGPTLLGTAGAIRNALDLLKDPFFVLYGDSYLDCDYRRIQTAFEESCQPALMTVFRNDGRWDRSNVELVDGRIVDYDKARQSPQMHYIDYGLGVFRQSVFEFLPAGVPCDLAQLYQALARVGKLAACQVDQRFYEIGSFEGLAETRRYLAARPQHRRNNEE